MHRLTQPELTAKHTIIYHIYVHEMTELVLGPVVRRPFSLNGG